MNFGAKSPEHTAAKQTLAPKVPNTRPPSELWRQKSRTLARHVNFGAKSPEHTAAKRTLAPKVPHAERDCGISAPEAPDEPASGRRTSVNLRQAGAGR